MEQWIMDLRFAARRIIRRPMYSVLTCLTLALGIGGSAAAFGIARNVLLEPLPYTNDEGIGVLWFPYSWTQEEFAFLRGRFPGFSLVAQYRPYDVTLELKDVPSRLINGISSSAELFDVLGSRPALGRTFQPGDELAGAEPVVVLSHGLWQELGGTASVVGSVIRADGQSRTVVGVMPRGFWFPSPSVRLWAPETLNPEQRSGNFTLIGRTAPGQTLDQFAAPLAQLTKILGERFTYPEQWDKTRNASVKPIREETIAPMRPALLATLVAMGMILLIACANVAALMLAQVEGRTTELAVRSALGAHRRRITSQLVAEALLLGVVAGAAGAGLAALAFRWLVAALPLGAWSESATLDWRVFSIAMVVGVLAALAVSLVPTLSLWRGRLRGAIGSSRTGGVEGRGVRLESALVVAEVALAVLMAAGAGLLIRSTSQLYAIDPGIDVDRVGVADMVLPANEPQDRQRQQLDELIAATRNLPGVEQAGVVQRLPLRGGGWSSGIAIEGREQPQVTTTFVSIVSRDYFATMGIPVLAGRTFEAPDDMAAV
jgi:putative ABC transport system permease protein